MPFIIICHKDLDYFYLLIYNGTFLTSLETIYILNYYKLLNLSFTLHIIYNQTA